MTPLETLLVEAIRQNGAIPFHRFMEAALYHPEYGYYQRRKDPFGKSGDFFTAAQLQPVFGVLIGAVIKRLFDQMGSPSGFTVVEIGAGRQEMAHAFREFAYVPVDLRTGTLPSHFCGVVFANEFFDALPVHALTASGGRLLEMMVGFEHGRFVWVAGERAGQEIESYAAKYLGPLEDGTTIEVNLDALRWLERIAQSLAAGYVLSIDYGYTSAELRRFPSGTLMSYRKHLASEDVLQRPGEQDITTHVCFTALQQHGEILGLQTASFETLAQTILYAGEDDQFAAALAGCTPEEQRDRRLQLKTLLFGMGETFRTLLQKKAENK